MDTFVTGKNDKITLKPHTKPTDGKQYINPHSCHCPHLIRSLPYSQALRIERICTNTNDMHRELTNVKGHFLNRGYEEAMIKDLEMPY